MHRITEIKEKMATLVNKWKNNKPVKFSDEWWRYRVDQIYYKSLRNKLASLDKKKDN